MNLTKEHSETINEAFDKMKKKMPGLRMIVSDEGVEIFDGKRSCHSFEGNSMEVTLSVMSFFLGISCAFRSDPTLKTLLKNL